MFVVLALVPLVIGGAAYGWASVLFAAPVVLAVAAGLYVPLAILALSLVAGWLIYGGHGGHRDRDEVPGV